jgi:hypothetical protein
MRPSQLRKGRIKAYIARWASESWAILLLLVMLRTEFNGVVRMQ